MIISFLGPPCSGKGTHTRILEHHCEFKIIGAGDLLRVAAKTNEEISQILDSGKLVPLYLIWNLIEQKLEEYLSQDPTVNILFDGFPREIAQAQMITQYLHRKQIPLHIINFCVDNDVLFERMNVRLMCNNCGYTMPMSHKHDKCSECHIGDMIRRTDDNPDTLRERINVYNENLQELKNFCEEKHHWFDMDGVGTIEEVQEKIQTYIANNKLVECKVVAK